MGVVLPVAPQRRAALNIGHSGTTPLCPPCYRIASPRRSCGSQAGTKRWIAELSDVLVRMVRFSITRHFKKESN